jgi:hypothetical protein
MNNSYPALTIEEEVLEKGPTAVEEAIHTVGKHYQRNPYPCYPT